MRRLWICGRYGLCLAALLAAMIIPARAAALPEDQIGRASCRERVFGLV